MFAANIALTQGDQSGFVGDIFVNTERDDFSDELSETLLCILRDEIQPRIVSINTTSIGGVFSYSPCFGYSDKSSSMERTANEIINALARGGYPSLKIRVNNSSPFIVPGCKVMNGCFIIQEQHIVHQIITQLIETDELGTVNLVIAIDGLTESKAKLQISGYSDAVEKTTQIKEFVINYGERTR